jgi:hypothetical protein
MLNKIHPSGCTQNLHSQSPFALLQSSFSEGSYIDYILSTTQFTALRIPPLRHSFSPFIILVFFPPACIETKPQQSKRKRKNPLKKKPTPLRHTPDETRELQSQKRRRSETTAMYEIKK